MKCRVALALMVLSAFVFCLSGCSGHVNDKSELEGQLEEVEASLKETASERDDLRTDVTKLKEALDKAESQLTNVVQSRDNLQKKVNELVDSIDELRKQVNIVTRARDELQNFVGVLIAVRDELQRQVKDLTASRNAALVETEKAQVRISELTTQLQKQVEEVSGLRDQVETIRSAVDELLTNLRGLLNPK